MEDGGEAEGKTFGEEKEKAEKLEQGGTEMPRRKNSRRGEEFKGFLKDIRNLFNLSLESRDLAGGRFLLLLGKEADQCLEMV